MIFVYGILITTGLFLAHQIVAALDPARESILVIRGKALIQEARDGIDEMCRQSVEFDGIVAKDVDALFTKIKTFFGA